MFSRRAQEYVSGYMRHELGLGAKSTHDLGKLDPETIVANPRRRRCGQAGRTLAGQPARVRTAPAERLARKKPGPKLKAETGDLEDALAIVRTVAKSEITHCRAGDLSGIEHLSVLSPGERLLLDAIRTLACGAETRMTLLIIHAQGGTRSPHAAAGRDDRRCRHPARSRQPGPRGAAVRDRHIAPLLDEPNATEPIYPGIDLRMVCTCSATDGSPDLASAQIR